MPGVVSGDFVSTIFGSMGILEEFPIFDPCRELAGNVSQNFGQLENPAVNFNEKGVIYRYKCSYQIAYLSRKEPIYQFPREGDRLILKCLWLKR